MQMLNNLGPGVGLRQPAVLQQLCLITLYKDRWKPCSGWQRSCTIK